MDFREYRGIRNLVIAEVTTDNSTKYETSEWRVLSGVQAVAKSVTESSEAHYYDNQAAIVIDSEGSDEYTLTVSVLDPEVKALIEGTSYVTNGTFAKGGMLVSTPKRKKYFALGFIGTDTDGNDEVNIIYKGKFSGGAETYNTKNDGTDATGVEYTYTSVHTTFKDTINGEKLPVKSVQFAMGDSVTELTVFGEFTDDVSTIKVQLPSELNTIGG